MAQISNLKLNSSQVRQYGCKWSCSEHVIVKLGYSRKQCLCWLEDGCFSFPTVNEYSDGKVRHKVQKCKCQGKVWRNVSKIKLSAMGIRLHLVPCSLCNVFSHIYAMLGLQFALD